MGTYKSVPQTRRSGNLRGSEKIVTVNGVSKQANSPGLSGGDSCNISKINNWKITIEIGKMGGGGAVKISGDNVLVSKDLSCI